MDSFDLYREAISEYERLIPDKQKGLVLLSLYSKFEDKEFNEEDIIEAIIGVNDSLGYSNDRTQYQKNNQLIIDFQDKFLWRDLLSKRYKFKSHGLQYCELILKRLQDDYNPAKIKRIFDELLLRLENFINQDEQNGFSLWLEDHFIDRKLNLSRQIESLDEQVSRSVEVFKKEIKKDLSQTEIIPVLDAMDKGLDGIKAQVSEMTEAFHATYDIDGLLRELVRRSLENKFDIQRSEQISTIFAFNKQVRSNLEQISIRIDKLKPKIRDFFAGFNRRDFDRKSVKFLEYLLHNSKLSNDNGKKSLSPPQNIQLPAIGESKLCPEFLIIPQKEIGIKEPTQIQKTTVDETRRESSLNKTKASLYKKKRVKYWVKTAFEIVEKQGGIDFSNFFFEILNSEHKNLSIALSTTQQVLKLSHNRSDLIIKIEPIQIRNQHVENVELWKFNIQKR